MYENKLKCFLIGDLSSAGAELQNVASMRLMEHSDDLDKVTDGSCVTPLLCSCWDVIRHNGVLASHIFFILFCGHCGGLNYLT